MYTLIYRIYWYKSTFKYGEIKRFYIPEIISLYEKRN